MFELDPAAPNVTASRYRQVSVTAVDSLDPDDLTAHFTGREAYVRTRFVVARLRDRPDQIALVELARYNSADLFSPAPAARVLARTEECAYVRDDWADLGIASHLAGAARRCPGARCVVVEGRYSHINFILNPDPIDLTVVDVVPPTPSKLADQVRRILDVAEDLPPVAVTERIIDSRELLAEARQPSPEPQENRHRTASSAAASPPGRWPSSEPDAGPQSVLVPCRGGGVDIDGAAVSYLDERPEPAGAWTLLGCQRSRQIHDWFYGTEPAEVVDWCPRRFVGPAADHPAAGCSDRPAAADHPAAGCSDGTDTPDRAPGPTAVASFATNPDDLVLSRCCLLEEGVERRGGAVWVPWGATLAEVRRAVELLVDERAGAWTPT